MSKRTVMGIFDPAVNTGRLVRELQDHGFSRHDILVFGGDPQSEESGEVAEPEELCTLFRNRGVPDVDAGNFAEGVRHGDVVVSVQTMTEEGSDEAADILDRHGAIDIEERVAGWQTEGNPEQETEAAALSAETLERSLAPEHQSGRTRGSRVFVW
jgi:hypothetical protein